MKKLSTLTQNSHWWLALGGIWLVGFLMLYFDLGQHPNGLNWDEAVNARDGIRAWYLGDYRAFYEHNFGREGFFVWLTSFMNAFLEPSVLAVRLPSTLLGTGTLLALLFAVRELWRPNQSPETEAEKAADVAHTQTGMQMALITLVLVAASYWFVMFSRFSYRIMPDVFFAVLNVWLVSKAFRKESHWGWSVVGGLMCGLGLYGYGTYKFMVFPLGALLLFRRPSLQKVLVMGVAALAAAAPLLRVMVFEPEIFFTRYRALSAPTAAPITPYHHNFVQLLRLLFVEGDAFPRRNLNSYPQLNPIAGVLTLLGFAQCVWFAWRQKADAWLPRRIAVVLALWWGAMFIPHMVVMMGKAQAVRSIGLLMPSYFLAGVGAVAVYRQLRVGSFRQGLAVMLGAFLFVSTGWQYHYMLRNSDKDIFQSTYNASAKALGEAYRRGETVAFVYKKRAKESMGEENILDLFRYYMLDLDGTKLDEVMIDPKKLKEYYKQNPEAFFVASKKYLKDLERLKIPQEQIQVW